jgi:NAD+-dependent protein deacetylase SIR2
MPDDITSDCSSDLSSVPSSPIAPPDFYPTPVQSQEVCSAAKVEVVPPPRKRRKVQVEPRRRQHLDLTSDAFQAGYDQQIALDFLLKTLRKRRKIVVVAGAGISVAAGIPDFRSSHGLFESLKQKHNLKASGKRLFDASVYKDDSSTSTFHDMVRDLSSIASQAKPTLFHRLLARLSSEGRLLRLYTQNIDGIDTSLPPLASKVPLNHRAPWPQTIQLHGGLEMMMCQKCQHTSDFQPHLFQGAAPPLCPRCTETDCLRTHHAGKRSHGIGKLRPRIVLYNEHNPDEDAIGAVVKADLRTRPDAIIVVGTSMKIPGVKRIVREMCGVVRGRRNGASLWINRDPVPAAKEFEDCWDLVVKGDADEVARRVNLKEWDDESEVSSEEYTLSELERVQVKHGLVEVAVSQTGLGLLRKVEHPAGMLTPPTSHDDEMSDRGHDSQGKLLTSKELSMTENPASKGRTILDVLGRPEPVRQRKRSVKKDKVTTGTKKQTTIGGKITKRKESTSKPRNEEGPQQVAEPTFVKIKPIVMFPNLEAFPSSPSSPAPDSRGTDAVPDKLGTISPTYRLPSGMEDLLN